MSEIVGPFVVEDATAAEATVVHEVAARLPAPMIAHDGGKLHLYFRDARRPRTAPSWAWGYATSSTRLWVNEHLAGKDRRHTLHDQQTYVLAHEYFHSWAGRHMTAAQRDAYIKLVGSTVCWRCGYYDGNKGSNRPSETAADSFARALGYGANLIPNFYRPKVTPDKYGQYLALLGGGATAPGPFLPTYQVRPPGAHLRTFPDLAATVIQTAEPGAQVQTGRSLTGGWWEVAGLHGSLWHEVLSVDGSLIVPPLWLADGVVTPLEASPSPTTPSRAASNG